MRKRQRNVMFWVDFEERWIYLEDRESKWVIYKYMLVLELLETSLLLFLQYLYTKLWYLSLNLFIYERFFNTVLHVLRTFIITVSMFLSSFKNTWIFQTYWVESSTKSSQVIRTFYSSNSSIFIHPNCKSVLYIVKYYHSTP